MILKWFLAPSADTADPPLTQASMQSGVSMQRLRQEEAALPLTTEEPRCVSSRSEGQVVADSWGGEDGKELCSCTPQICGRSN